MAIKGQLATGELMVVGRAVNGGLVSLEPESLDDTLARIKHASLSQSGSCPLAWVTNMWGNRNAYNTRRSAFWRVIRRVVQELQIADTTQDTWPSHLIWSNLYKVAPADGGNPSERLAKAQEGHFIELLAEELRGWTPKRVLFLTGLDWAGSFLDGLKAEVEMRQEESLVQAAGRIPLGSDKWGTFVVARHPQGKPEDEILKGITTLFKTVKI